VQRKPLVHKVTLGTSYQVNADGDLAEGMWLFGCTCGWSAASGFLHTAQKEVREHLGLKADWDSRKIETPGLEGD
jgi:hypothetical protein